MSSNTAINHITEGILLDIGKWCRFAADKRLSRSPGIYGSRLELRGLSLIFAPKIVPFEDETKAVVIIVVVKAPESKTAPPGY